MSSHPISAVRPIGRVGFLVILSLALTACTGAASPTPHSAGTPTPGASSAPATSVTAAVPDARAITSTGVASSGVAAGAAGGGIAYPYPIYGGTPGTAPDHSILVTGTGQSAVKADGSDATTAEKAALGKALAEAKRRADEIAAATGVTITGVLSVSESLGQGWIAPVGVDSPGGVSIPPSNGTEPAPAPPVPTNPELEVTVIVAYSIGS